VRSLFPELPGVCLAPRVGEADIAGNPEDLLNGKIWRLELGAASHSANHGLYKGKMVASTNFRIFKEV
jgi:hypothetical protein